MSTMLISPQPQLEEFHQQVYNPPTLFHWIQLSPSQVATNSIPPWFSVDASHKLLLSVTHPKVAAAKSPVKTPIKPRPEDTVPTSVSNTPRPKTDAPTPTSTVAPSSPLAPKPGNPPLNPAQALIHEKVKALWQAFQACDNELRNNILQMSSLKQAGKIAEAQAKEAVAKDKLATAEKIKQQLNLPQVFAILVQLGLAQAGEPVDTFLNKARSQMVQKAMQPPQQSPATVSSNAFSGWEKC
jgi:hypothetical protein